ncbi:MAG TPA: hypothetical protein VIM97_04620 [Actinomycetes bacterium]
MGTAGRSAPLRRTGSLLGLLGLELAAVVGLHWLGRFQGLQIGWDAPVPWLLSSPVQDILAALLRTVALVMAYWLLASTLLYLLASLTRLPSAVRAVSWATLPVVRRVADHAVAVTLATSMVGGGTLGVAGPALAADRGRAGPPARKPVAAAQATDTSDPAYNFKAQEQGKDTSTSESTTTTNESTTTSESTTTTTPTTTSTTTPPTSATTTTTAPTTTATTRPTTTTERETTTTRAATSTTRPAPTTTRPPAPPAYVPTPAQGPSSTTTTTSTTSTTGPPSSTSTSTTGLSPPAYPFTAATPSTPKRKPPPPENTGGQQGGGGQAAQKRRHEVARGDNLWLIAKERLAAARSGGSGEPTNREVARYWIKVLEANKHHLRSGDPDLIYPDEEIILPPVDD